MNRAILFVGCAVLGCTYAENSGIDHSCVRDVADALVEILEAHEVSSLVVLNDARSKLSETLRGCPELEVLARPMFGPFTRLDIAVFAWDVGLIKELLDCAGN